MHNICFGTVFLCYGSLTELFIR
uniref:Uncharacterized protein n=1 Tax=Anguilla anguilla TaxID=7936 RepID=A0A0E9RVQ3_ANGAN